VVSNRWASLQPVIGLIDGRWTLAVLAELQDGGRRYQDLDDALDGVSHKVLTDTLRRAERDGLLILHLDPGRVETATLYQLTALGRSLDEPLGGLERWVDANWPEIEERLDGDGASAATRTEIVPSSSRGRLWVPRTPSTQLRRRSRTRG
jgi:DNA-binding HxlR family transcriptional regulator